MEPAVPSSPCGMPFAEPSEGAVSQTKMRQNDAAAAAAAEEDATVTTLARAFAGASLNDATAPPRKQRDPGGTGPLPPLTDAWGIVFNFFTLSDARAFSRVCGEACGLVCSTWS